MDKSQDENRCLIFNNFAEEKGKIWFWAVNYNALFQGSIDGGIALSVWGIEDCEETTGSLYNKVVKCGNKIIGISALADNILVYDIFDEGARLIPIPTWDWGNAHTLERGRFWDGVVYGDYVFMIGFWSAKILKFDVANENIVDVIDLYEGLDIPFESRFLSFKNTLVVDNKILIPSYVKNYIFVLNPDNMQYEKIVIEKNGSGFSDIVYDGENIWLSPRERGQFVKWNMQKSIIYLYDDYPTEVHMEDQANFTGMGYCNGKVYVFPYRADKVISIKKNEDNVVMQAENVFNCYYEGFEGVCTNKEVMKYLFVQSVEERLYSFCADSRRVLSYNTKNGLLSELKFLISDEDYLRYGLRKWEIVKEDHGSLSLFIKILADDAQKDYVNQGIKHTIGEEIYNRVERD